MLLDGSSSTSPRTITSAWRTIPVAGGGDCGDQRIRGWRRRIATDLRHPIAAPPSGGRTRQVERNAGRAFLQQRICRGCRNNPGVGRTKDVVVLDKLSHAWLIDGAKLSGASCVFFRTTISVNWKAILSGHGGNIPGARPDCHGIHFFDGRRPGAVARAGQPKAPFWRLVFLDEAHAIGVVGVNGRGAAAEEGVGREVEVRMGTLSKALGGSGGYICGSWSLIDWLINRARPFILRPRHPQSRRGGVCGGGVNEFPEGEERRHVFGSEYEQLKSYCRRQRLDGGQIRSREPERNFSLGLSAVNK